MRTCYVDGGCLGNPGRMYGSYMVFEDNGDIITKRFDISGEGTNNQAEYLSLITLLTYLIFEDKLDALIRMDSLLVINQVTDIYNTKNGKLKQLKDEAARMLNALNAITFEHISGKRMKIILGH